MKRMNRFKVEAVLMVLLLPFIVVLSILATWLVPMILPR
jgi:hypothetical protein